MGKVGNLTMKSPGKRAVIAAAWPAEAAEWSELLEKLGFSLALRIPGDRGPEVDTVYYGRLCGASPV